MDSTQLIARGTVPVGGEVARRPMQQYPLLSKWFTSDLLAIPVRVLYGRDFIAGTQITPVFGFRSEEVHSDVSAGK